MAFPYCCLIWHMGMCQCVSPIYIYIYIQGVQDEFSILIFCSFFRLVGGMDTHYASFESLDLPSFIYMMTERMDDWNPPESWKRITCIMMIHAGHQKGDYGCCSMLPEHC